MVAYQGFRSSETFEGIEDYKLVGELDNRSTRTPFGHLKQRHKKSLHMGNSF